MLPAEPCRWKPSQTPPPCHLRGRQLPHPPSPPTAGLHTLCVHIRTDSATEAVAATITLDPSARSSPLALLALHLGRPRPRDGPLGGSGRPGWTQSPRALGTDGSESPASGWGRLLPSCPPLVPQPVRSRWPGTPRPPPALPRNPDPHHRPAQGCEPGRGSTSHPPGRRFLFAEPVPTRSRPLASHRSDSSPGGWGPWRVTARRVWHHSARPRVLGHGRWGGGSPGRAP